MGTAPRIELGHLPAGAPHFLGREAELEALDAALGADLDAGLDPALDPGRCDGAGTAVVELVAPGGTGKTALVRRWLDGLARRGWGGDRFPGLRVYAWSFYSQGTGDDRQASEDHFLAAAIAWFGVEIEASANPADKGQALAEALTRHPAPQASGRPVPNGIGNGAGNGTDNGAGNGIAHPAPHGTGAPPAGPTLLILDGCEPLQYPPGPLAGGLRAPGLKALLTHLASVGTGTGRGAAAGAETTAGSAAGRSVLCVLTTREPIRDLDEWVRDGPSRPGLPHGPCLRLDLENLGDTDGARLLHTLGADKAGAAPIAADDPELIAASRAAGGHALTLSLLGNYLRLAHGGDLRARDRVDWGDASAATGGHAFRVMAAYERWLETGGDEGARCLAALRLLGLFDRPATPDLLATLRAAPPIPGLTEPLFLPPPAPDRAAPTSAATGNPPTASPATGSAATGSADILSATGRAGVPPATARSAATGSADILSATGSADILSARSRSAFGPLALARRLWRLLRASAPPNGGAPTASRRSQTAPSPDPIPATHWRIALTRLKDAGLIAPPAPAPCASDPAAEPGLDAHPLVRAYLADALATRNPDAWREGHRRLYERLKASVPHRPEGLDGLQPLYQAVTHGCRAGLYEEARTEVYRDRILRGTGPDGFYSAKKLGAFGADLGAVACFFADPWSRPAPALAEDARAWLLSEAATRLRALGRLTEALEPMRAGAAMRAKQEAWKNAAIAYGNLSELQLALGRIDDALGDAGRSLEHAERIDDAFKYLTNQTTLADALHQRGKIAEALGCFAEAEAIQAEFQPEYPLLYSLWGFRYCDLLLAGAERAAWDAIPEKAGATGPEAAEALATCESVARRARQTLEWIEDDNWLLDIALDHLTLARSALYADRLQGRPPGPEAQAQTEQAVNGLHAAGRQDYLPLGLLTRAWLRHTRGDLPGAEADLAEAERIARRGGMQLHLADCALHRARLFHDRAALAEARRLIERCRYGRRLPELEDAERAAAIWPEPTPDPRVPTRPLEMPPATLGVAAGGSEPAGPSGGDAERPRIHSHGSRGSEGQAQRESEKEAPAPPPSPPIANPTERPPMSDERPPERRLVYLSYSHRDQAWHRRLRAVLDAHPAIEDRIWDDTRCPPGRNVTREIRAHVPQARVMIMLGSPDYFAPECGARELEIEPALADWRRGELDILWLRLREHPIHGTPVADIMAANGPGAIPLDSLPPEEQDAALRHLRDLVLELIGAAPAGAAPVTAAPFDCFLSHNTSDKPRVRELARALADRGLRCWLDEAQLRPGVPWQPLLEQGIRDSAAVAVCIAADGLGPWQDAEMQAALQLAVKNPAQTVMAVLLPGAPDQVTLPAFLSIRGWVDLRAGIGGDGLDRLIWGITGQRPGAPGHWPDPGVRARPGGDPPDTASVPPPPAPAPAATAAPAPAATGGGDPAGRPLAAIALWREKLAFLLEQEAIVTDPAQRFQIKKGIEECRAKLRELGGEA